jgi:hypothetical protein
MELLVVGRWRMYGRRVKTVDEEDESDVVRGIAEEVAPVVLLTVGAEDTSVSTVEVGECRESSAVVTLHVEESSSSRTEVCCGCSSVGISSDELPFKVRGVLRVIVRLEVSWWCNFFATKRYC